MRPSAVPTAKPTVRKATSDRATVVSAPTAPTDPLGIAAHDVHQCPGVSQIVLAAPGGSAPQTRRVGGRYRTLCWLSRCWRDGDRTSIAESPRTLCGGGRQALRSDGYRVRPRRRVDDTTRSAQRRREPGVEVAPSGTSARPWGAWVRGSAGGTRRLWPGPMCNRRLHVEVKPATVGCTSKSRSQRWQMSGSSEKS